MYKYFCYQDFLCYRGWKESSLSKILITCMESLFAVVLSPVELYYSRRSAISSWLGLISNLAEDI